MLPALMNSIKMIHTIARYYNSNDRMTSFFQKITHQMVVVSCGHILDACQVSELQPFLPTPPTPDARCLSSLLMLACL